MKTKDPSKILKMSALAVAHAFADIIECGCDGEAVSTDLIRRRFANLMRNEGADGQEALVYLERMIISRRSRQGVKP